ncbi:hypothetical protein QTN80_01815 [Arachnia propionica]|uniref:hypothetical protein n=1 Tax=Arachnia propionica TaxID=1750 RepID=UPI001BA8CF9C|nr:hypothetical protein [Arachnia propionica]QUC14488.1 hypothetical protein J5A61_01670 [Arachnia propionica]
MSQTSDDFIDTGADDIPIAANRRVLVLRALRIGGLIAALPSTVLAVVWWNSFPLPHDLLRSFLQLLLPLPALWVASALVRKVYLWFDNKFARRIWQGARKFFASLVAVYMIALTGWHVHRWWHFYADFSFSIIVLLTLAALTVALGLAVAVDLWLRGIRDQRDVLPGEPDDPARFRPFRPDANDEDDSGSSRRRGRRYWGRRFIALLAPALALTLTLLLVHDTSNPVVQTTAHAPDGPLPTRPTRIGSRIAWEKDVPGLLDIAAGVTGPLILTPEGLTAVNPVDGSTLWSYHRTGAQYVSLREGVWYNMFGPGRYRSYLLTNPNGHYVAFRIDAPDGLEQGGKEIRDGILTIIIDTTTGQVTSERLTGKYSTLQLTDTAFFDGATAYNLSDGQARWTLEAGTTKGDKSFTGPAGHNSFVIDMMINPNSRQHIIYDLTLASDKDPSQNTTASNFPEADESSNDRPVSINGWTVQYAEKVDDPDHYTAWQMQAVSFDSLAGLEDAPAVDLGKTSGPNIVASHASGTVALYPYTSSSDPAAQQVGTVFDPATRTVTPASGCAGPVAVRLGITRVADGGSVSRALAIRPCDGSDGLTLPVVPGPFRPPTKTEGSAPRQLSKRSQQEQITTMMNVPGTTLVVFNPEGEVKANGASDIDRKYPYHLYALAGDAS